MRILGSRIITPQSVAPTPTLQASNLVSSSIDIFSSGVMYPQIYRIRNNLLIIFNHA
jgi:hypothetical protein